MTVIIDDLLFSDNVMIERIRWTVSMSINHRSNVAKSIFNVFYHISFFFYIKTSSSWERLSFGILSIAFEFVEVEEKGTPCIRQCDLVCCTWTLRHKIFSKIKLDKDLQ